MRMRPSRSNRFVGRAASSFSREFMRQQRAKQRYEARHGKINNNNGEINEGAVGCLIFLAIILELLLLACML
jgi:hypothetical protein